MIPISNSLRLPAVSNHLVTKPLSLEIIYLLFKRGKIENRPVNGYYYNNQEVNNVLKWHTFIIQFVDENLQFNF